MLAVEPASSCRQSTAAEPAFLSAWHGLFTSLNAAGVRYGAFEGTYSLRETLAGERHLGILVAREDYGGFCDIVRAFAGLRTVSTPMLHRSGHEDWFVPDFDAASYLHLDVYVAFRVGDWFSGQPVLYTWEDVERWEEHCSGVPVASAMDEARISLTRTAFCRRGWPWQRWVGPVMEWNQEVIHRVFPAGAADTAEIRWEGRGIACRVRRCADGFQVRADDLRQLRRWVRKANGEWGFHAVADSMRNCISWARYLTGRAIDRSSPGAPLDRRRPVNGGLIVAVVAPDGLGKSTQTERLRALFASKFCTRKIYLGTGDGEGWWLRRMIVVIYLPYRMSIRRAAKMDDTSAKSDDSRKSLLRCCMMTMLSLYGLLAATERYSKVRKARRVANRGFIVITDRWPQSLCHGCMDGPLSINEAHLFPWLRFIRRRELALYDRMTQIAPDLWIHLEAEFSVSAERKPGELDYPAFARRIEAMKKMRQGPGEHIVVDAAQSLDAVSADLFTCIWKRL